MLTGRASSPLGLWAFPSTPSPTSSPSSSSPSSSFVSLTRGRCTPSRAAPSTSDPFILQVAEAFEDSVSPLPSSLSLQKLRDFSSRVIISTSWPTRRDESFRFTDTSMIRHSEIAPVVGRGRTPHSIPEGSPPTVTLIDGRILSMHGVPVPVRVGTTTISSLIPDKVHDHIDSYSGGDLFWSLNGMGAPDVITVFVPAGRRIEKPLILKYLSSEGVSVESTELPTSNPRVIVYVEERGEVSIVEEYPDGSSLSRYWTNCVTEIVLEKHAKLCHSHVQNHSVNAVHFKWTSVLQEGGSVYYLTDVSTGGKLSRHNVHVRQAGPNTSTSLSTFHVSAAIDQAQELHTRIVLSHPGGHVRQLHKCIVARSSGRAVFDGNIRVERDAQGTDADQLTRCLLLEPRATANIKPNLQIVADDVRCTHGATVSDLEEDQLFYFRARGVGPELAKKALILSFGRDAIHSLPAEVRDVVRSDLESVLEKCIQEERLGNNAVFV